MEIYRMFEELMDVPYVIHEIDKDGFHEFMEAFQPYIDRHEDLLKGIPLAEGFNGWNFDCPSIEKKLEYYLSLNLLQWKPEHRYVDIASCYSVFPSYVADVCHCETWRQDYYYKQGISGACIGSDACRIPVEDNFFDSMTLHCSFEHFEGSKDGEFIREAGRILKPGGKLCIIPFYCGYDYTEIQKDNFDTGCQFHRYYNPEEFKKRVFDGMENLNLTFYWFSNLNSLGEDLYCHFALIFEKV